MAASKKKVCSFYQTCLLDLVGNAKMRLGPKQISCAIIPRAKPGKRACHSFHGRFTFSFSRYGGGYDLAARRKNATRESTATLKAWLSEHKKNPYPTKGEKIMLAIITKMTLTQVSESWRDNSGNSQFRQIGKTSAWLKFWFPLSVTGQYVVREREETAEEGEQDDVGAQEQARRRGRRRVGRRRQERRRQARYVAAYFLVSKRLSPVFVRCRYFHPA